MSSQGEPSSLGLWLMVVNRLRCAKQTSSIAALASNPTDITLSGQPSPFSQLSPRRVPSRACSAKFKLDCKPSMLWIQWCLSLPNVGKIVRSLLVPTLGAPNECRPGGRELLIQNTRCRPSSSGEECSHMPLRYRSPHRPARVLQLGTISSLGSSSVPAKTASYLPAEPARQETIARHRSYSATQHGSSDCGRSGHHRAHNECSTNDNQLMCSEFRVAFSL